MENPQKRHSPLIDPIGIYYFVSPRQQGVEVRFPQPARCIEQKPKRESVWKAGVLAVGWMVILIAFAKWTEEVRYQDWQKERNRPPPWGLVPAHPILWESVITDGIHTWIYEGPPEGYKGCGWIDP
jgi:hypothetical protein